MQIIQLNNRLIAQFIAVLSALFLVHHYKEHYEDYYLEKHDGARDLLSDDEFCKGIMEELRQQELRQQELSQQPPAKGGEKAAKGDDGNASGVDQKDGEKGDTEAGEKAPTGEKEERREGDDEESGSMPELELSGDGQDCGSIPELLESFGDGQHTPSQDSQPRKAHGSDAAAAARAARAADGVGAHDEKKFPRWRGVSGCAVCRKEDHRTMKCDQRRIDDWIREKCTSNTGRRRAVGLFGHAKVDMIAPKRMKEKRQQGDDEDGERAPEGKDDCGEDPLPQDESHGKDDPALQEALAADDWRGIAESLRPWKSDY